MGAATAWALSSRGADVTVYEQFEPGTERGSSHGRTRIFRLAYPDASWVELAQEALAGWRELEQQSGQELLGMHGSWSSRRHRSSRRVTHSRRSASSTCCSSRLGTCARCRGAAGLDGAPPGRRGNRSGRSCDRRFLGDMPLERRRVESLDDVEADVVVVTAGAWVRKLVPDVPVRVTRETIAYFRAGADRAVGGRAERGDA